MKNGEKQAKSHYNFDNLNVVNLNEEKTTLNHE